MRRLVIVLPIVAAVLLLLVLALPFLIDANEFRPAHRIRAAKVAGQKGEINDLKLGILSGTITASGLSLADDPSFSRTAFLRTKALRLSIDLWRALFSRKLSVNGIDIDQPEIVLIQLPSGLWNFSSLGTKSSTQPGGSGDGSPALSVKSLKINGARLSLTQAAAQPEILDDVNIEVKDFAPGSSFPFALSAKIAGGGDISLGGKAGPIDSADLANTPLTATLKVVNLNLAASGAVPSSSGIDGVVSLDGTASSNGQGLEMTGKLADRKNFEAGFPAPGCPARNPLLFDFAMSADLKRHSGQMSRGDVAIGGVKASLTGMEPAGWGIRAEYESCSAGRAGFRGWLNCCRHWISCCRRRSTLEGGTATASWRFPDRASPQSVISWPGERHEHARLKGFNLSVKMSPIEKLAGLKSGPSTGIQSLSANLRTTPEGTSLRDIHLVLPSVGELTGGGTISRGHALNFKTQASLHSGTLVGTFPWDLREGRVNSSARVCGFEYRATP